MAEHKTEVHASFAVWHIRAGDMALTPNPSTPQLLRLNICEDVRIILDRDTSDTAEQAAAMRELARLATEAAEDLEGRGGPAPDEEE